MDIVIREAKPTDKAVIVELIIELGATGGERSPITAAYVEKYLASPTSKVLLAETQNQVMGLLSYSVRPDLYHAASACLIEELIVQEKSRGRGVGSALLAALLSRLEALGCAEVSVAALSDNEQAIKFYRAHGLTEEAVFLEKHFK